MTDELETLQFTVQGIPVPQGSKSVFRGRLVDANKNLKPWRLKVTAAAEKAIFGRPPFDTAVAVFYDFYLPRPRTVSRKYPTVKPDLDKLERAIGDSLTTAKVWTDDSLAVTSHTQKRYADDLPFVSIKIRRLA